MGNEWLIPGSHVDRAIRAADQSGIAILGIEAFTEETGGLLTQDLSGYEFDSHFPKVNWADFVRMNNDAAKRWIVEHGRAEYSYILTNTSRREYEGLSG